MKDIVAACETEDQEPWSSFLLPPSRWAFPDLKYSLPLGVYCAARRPEIQTQALDGL